MPELQQLTADHAPAVLAFELANRAYFAASISDRGDDFFAHFDDEHRALLAEQEAGAGAFYVLVADDGSVVGRFNLFRIADGRADIGYRIAEHVAGRGVATTAVEELCGLAAARHGLRTLRAATSLTNVASQRVLSKAGFVPTGAADPSDLGGKPGTWYERDLALRQDGPVRIRGASGGVLNATPAAELLRRRLELSSMAQLLAVYGASDVRAEALRADLPSLPRATADQVRLLVLGGSLTVDDAVDALGRDVIDGLLDEEVLVRPEPGLVATPSLRLVEHWGSLLICDQQSASSTRYFGTDSTALGRVVLGRSGAWLDVCAGVGVQSMLALARTGAVVAVDVNPDVARLLDFNAQLNGFPPDRISFVCGRAEQVDLAAVTPADGFRTVTCNPPWMPLPESVRFALVGHGGPDGLAVTRPLLERLPDLLHEEGAAVVVALLLGDESGPFLEPFGELAQQTGLDIEVLATCRVPASSGGFFDLLVATAANFGGRDEAAIREELTDHYAAMGAGCLFSAYLIARHARGTPGVEHTALWKRAQAGWFV